MKIKYILSDDKRVQEYNEIIRKNFPEFIEETCPDLLYIAGGDGAMLHAIKDTISYGVPYFGKGLGTFNFLLNEFEDDLSLLRSISNDEFKLKYYKTYAIKVELNNKSIGEAFNDVILGDKLLNYFHFSIDSESKDFENLEFSGCGVCISTAIGSTAFNFNNNGHILPLDSNLLSITGIVTNKYLNDITHFQRIDLKCFGAKLRDGSKKAANIYLSGIKSGEISEGDILTLRKGSQVKIAFLSKEKFVQKRIELAHRYRK
ncbi:NAD(+)/NADH kinase [Candidatus Dojkabacteria bacterium]|nr:NAD(+)/NADH kinase [Candidatus Dojkabacteria bacterium]